MIGKTIDIVVTSVLQTTAGKMIFGRFIDASMAAQAAAPVAAAASSEATESRRPRPQAPPAAPATVTATAGK
jgi:hypothetical protein